MSSNDVQTLANSIIGTSILAMPFCFAKCGIILSILLLIISTAITRACCNYLIKASIVTRRRNMELLGFYVFGSSGKALVEISVIGFLMGTCVAFFVVIGDLCPILVSKLFNIQNTSNLRLWMIILTTFVCIIPLSFQQSIKSLSFVCKASIAFYICLTLKTVVESFITFRNDDHWASNIELWNLSGVLQCIPIFSMAMSCQMQLFEVYENISSFDRIRSNIYHATSICLIVYTTIGFFGYVAFYNENLSGNILVNFRPSLSNDLITFGFILSIACSFPLVIFPCRTSLNSLLHKSKVHHHSEINPYVPESRYKPLTLFIIFFTMIIGILIPSVEVIIGFVGSTIGILICVLFPSIVFVKIMQRNSGEKIIAQAMILLGFVIMVLGTYSNLVALDKASSGSHINQPVLIPDAVPAANIPPPAAVAIELPESVAKKKNETILKDPGKISEDGIKKEELEMQSESSAVINKDVQKEEIKKKDEVIKELKEDKKKLEKEVQEMKKEIVKQNKETQQLVLQKFEEIAEKVDQLQSEKEVKDDDVKKSVEAKENEGVIKKPDEVQKEELPKVVEKVAEIEEKVDVKDDAKVKDVQPPYNEEIIKQVEEPKKIIDDVKEEPKKDLDDTASSVDENLQVLNKPLDPVKSEVLSKSEKLVVEAPVVENELKKEVINEKPEKPSNLPPADPIVQHIVQKSQEPLSYQVGEKIMEEKKKNLTSIDKSNQTKVDELSASREDPKNEMRKRRDAVDEMLDKNPIVDQLKSVIGRDLKNVNDHDES